MKSARLAEKGAAAERTALYKHYAAADETLKGALRSARLNEQTAAEERRKAVAAIEALKAEEYDANQARHGRKWPRRAGKHASRWVYVTNKGRLLR